MTPLSLPLGPEPPPAPRGRAYPVHRGCGGALLLREQLGDAGVSLKKPLFCRTEIDAGPEIVERARVAALAARGDSPLPTPAGGRRMWKAREIDLLRRFYAASGSGPVDLRVLGKLLGRSKPSVARKAHLLGLTDQGRASEIQPSLPLLGHRTPEELSGLKSTLAKKRIADHGHPRGFAGKVHGPAARAAIGAKARRAWTDPSSGFNTEAYRQGKSDRMSAMNAGRPAENTYSRCAQGRREDLGGLYVRSSWEANYARYLNLLLQRTEIVSWRYEAHTFWFEEIKRGTRSYTPDFEVTYPDGRREWHEVKGWMDPKSATRLARMAKYFPDQVVRVIGQDWFRGAVRGGLAATIPGWEGRA